MPKPAISGPTVVGVAWYRESDWPRVKSQFPDAATLHDTYDQWRRSAEKAIKDITATGHIVVPVTVDIDEFTGWCLVRGCKRDGKARAQYVTDKLKAAPTAKS